MSISTPLSAIRQASGAPSLRELARKFDCSVQSLSSFEQGRAVIGSTLMQQYARAIGLDVDVVRQLFLRCKVQFHKREAARAAEQLKASSGKPRRLAKAG